MDDNIGTEKAAQALNEFASGPASDAANLAAEAFETAADRIAKSLESAAKSGTLNFRDMASSITRDLASLAIKELILDPLQSAISGSGAGGFGSGFSGGGQGTASPVSVIMNVTGVSDFSGFQKSTSQISASLARAVSQGQKLF